jgi:molecular chaperone DnaJ
VTYYGLLNIPMDATPEDIKHSYRLLAKKLHPDVGTHADSRYFVALQKIYETLLDPAARERYDQQLLKSNTYTTHRNQRFVRVDPKRIVYNMKLEQALKARLISKKIRREDRLHYFKADLSILLTPYEQTHGAMAPLPLPARKTCDACMGMDRNCIACKGTGKIKFNQTVSFMIPPHTPNHTLIDVEPAKLCTEKGIAFFSKVLRIRIIYTEV